MAYLLQHLLAATARRFPDRQAVVYEDESISYAELDSLSNRLARSLNAHGVRQGDRVGIYLNKSLASIISIHGILKAGAAYVPLDPKSPARRLAYIIRNCGISCLLTSPGKLKQVRAMFTDASPLKRIWLIETADSPEPSPADLVTWREVLDLEDSDPPGDASIDRDLAYILYTSGSTGLPKGVMISHLNALTFVDWAFDTFKVTPQDRLSNHAPLHFDLSIFDIFVSLKAGATLVLVPESVSTFPRRMAEWIEANRISVWYSVPSVLGMLLLYGQIERCSFENLRLVLFAGEVFPTAQLRRLMTVLPQAEYHNLYGPTETNVITSFRVPTLDPERTATIPIGRPCANSTVILLDDAGQPVTDPGVEGELYARGSIVAQGYWADEDKTRSLFLTGVDATHPEERFYRTGDLATLDEEGNFLFLGRRDHMIKSRGYRIELGEIEAALYAHPEVKEAAAVAIPDELIGNRIKALVVLVGKCSPSEHSIQKFCSERLPRQMVPEIVEFRSHLPRTSTGKVDRQRLATESAAGEG